VVRVNALEDEEENGKELKIGSFKTGGEEENEETGVEIEVRAFEVASYKLVLG
jgi:alpha-mannosidase